MASRKQAVEEWAKTRPPCTKCGGSDFSKAGVCRPCNRAAAKAARDRKRGAPSTRGRFTQNNLGEWVCPHCGSVDVNVTPSGGKHCRPCTRVKNVEKYHNMSDGDRNAWYKQQKRWNKENSYKRAAYISARRARIPTWLTDAHWKEIYDIYSDAKLYTVIDPDGEEYHVDHIIPLQGADICGLHVPWNLQILPAGLNLAKSNLYDPAAAWDPHLCRYPVAEQLRRPASSARLF